MMKLSATRVFICFIFLLPTMLFAQGKKVDGTRQVDSLRVQQLTDGTASTGQIIRFDGVGWNPWTPNFLTSFTETDPTYTASIPYQMMNKTDIPSSSDLNTYQTTGLYGVPSDGIAASLTSNPFPYAGYLEVVNQGAFIYQTYTSYKVFGTSNDKWFRNLYGGIWSAWKRILTDADGVLTTTPTWLQTLQVNNVSNYPFALNSGIVADQLAYHRQYAGGSNGAHDIVTYYNEALTTQNRSRIIGINDAANNYSSGFLFTSHLVGNGGGTEVNTFRVMNGFASFPQLAGATLRMATIAVDGTIGTASMPTIPTVNDGVFSTSATGFATLTGSFTANQAGNSMLTLTTPTSSTAGQLFRRNASNTGYEFWTPTYGNGTLTSFSSGSLLPLFTTTVANATTAPALSFSLTVAGANTFFGNNTGSSIAPSYNMMQALTKTDDANVTLTLGGTPATSMLKAVSMTLGWNGFLSVPRGGTGVGTLTGIAIGNGTSAFTGVAGTAGQLLRRNAANTAYEFFTANYQTQINGTGFVKANGTTITYDNSNYVADVPSNTSSFNTLFGQRSQFTTLISNVNSPWTPTGLNSFWGVMNLLSNEGGGVYGMQLAAEMGNDNQTGFGRISFRQKNWQGLGAWTELATQPWVMSKGYRQSLWSVVSTNLNSDAASLTGFSGIQQGTTANAPFNYGFALTLSGGSSEYTQLASDVVGQGVYYRKKAFSDGSPTAWRRPAFADEVNDSYVKGGTDLASNLNNLGLVSSFMGSISNPVQVPINNDWWNIISVRHRNGLADGPSYGLQIGNPMTVSNSIGRLFFRNQAVSWGSWYEIATTDKVIQNQVASAQTANGWITGGFNANGYITAPIHYFGTPGTTNDYSIRPDYTIGYLGAFQNGTTALGMKMGSLAVSNTYADVAPTNGLFVKGVSYLAGNTFTDVVMPYTNATLVLGNPSSLGNTIRIPNLSGGGDRQMRVDNAGNVYASSGSGGSSWWDQNGYPTSYYIAPSNTPNGYAEGIETQGLATMTHYEGGGGLYNVTRVDHTLFFNATNGIVLPDPVEFPNRQLRVRVRGGSNVWFSGPLVYDLDNAWTQFPMGTKCTCEETRGQTMIIQSAPNNSGQYAWRVVGVMN